MQHFYLQGFGLQSCPNDDRRQTNTGSTRNPHKTSSRFTRGLVWLVILVALLANVCFGQDVYDNFCYEAVKAMRDNNELFKSAQAGFSLTTNQIFRSDMLSACKNMPSVKMLQELSSFKNLPSNAKDAIRGGLEKYDSMVDEWAHIYWAVGRRASEKDFQDAKLLMWHIMSFWENQPGYSKIYAQLRKDRLDANNVLEKLEKDVREIQAKSKEYSPNVLPSSNTLGKRLKENVKKWPLKEEDLPYWNIPKVYNVTWLTPQLLIVDTYKRNIVALDDFTEMVVDLAKRIKVVGAAYSEWQDIANKAVKFAPTVAKLSDSRFAQDNLTADFRETMEDAADTLLEYHKLLITEINSTGYRELDQAMNFLESDAGKELAGKSGPLYKGTNGSTNKIMRTFELVAKQMVDLYYSAVNVPSTIEEFCKDSVKAIQANNEILKECNFRFNMDGTRIIDSNYIEKFKETKRLKTLNDTDAYKNLPQKSRDAVREIVDPYDHMLAGYVDFYQQVAEDAKNDKFIAAKKYQAMAVYDWQGGIKNYQEKYRKMLEERKKEDQAIQKFKKDMEDIKRHINDPSPQKLSSDNILGQAAKKENHWPVRDSELSHWNLNKIYNLNWMMTESCDVHPTKRTKIKEFDDYAQYLQNVPVYQDAMKRVLTRWNEKWKLLGTYGAPVAKAANSNFAKQYLTPTLIHELEDASKLHDAHVRKIQEQLNGKLGFKLIEETNKVLGNDNARDVINRKGLLYRGISMTRSITETYFELTREVKQRYQDAAK